MTDGEPTKDGGSYSSIEDLTGETCSSYNGNKNCLPTLAGYMASPGLGGLDNDPYTGNQKAFTYTIGFATDQQLLRDTADRGNGVCYTTVGNNTDSTTGCVVVENIAAAFQGALGEILQQTSTFVSPAVAVNSFKRIGLSH